MNPSALSLSVDWKPLFRFTWWCAVAMLALIPVQVVIYLVSPPPESVTGFFELFRENWLLGLLSLDLLYLFNNTLIIFIYLSLSIMLWPTAPKRSLVALVLGIIGITLYYTTNPSFEFWSLSTHYFAASEASKFIYLAAGEGLFAGYTGTAFNVYYLLNAFVLLLYAWALLENPKYKKSLGYFGLASAILMSIPSSAGVLGLIFSLLSLIPWIGFVGLLLKPLRSAD